MPMITIFDRTYALPAIVTERFRTLRDQVREQQQVIQTSLRPQPRLFGIIPLAPRALKPEERWEELDLLVRNYDAIIAELRMSKESYEAFFSQLAVGVQQALMRQSETMQHLEEERLAEALEAEREQDEDQQRQLRDTGEMLMQGVRVLGRAARLLLKKIALCEESLARLVEDQDLQRRVLTELTGRLGRHRRAYLLRKRIEQAVQEAARMAEVALHFEEYMRDHLGPLQGLLEQVVHVDGDLHRAVTEIEDLTRQLEQQRLTPLPGSEMLDEQWLTFLTTSQLKKERLVDLWKRLEQQDGNLEALEIDIATSAPNAMSPVLTALDNIRRLVEVRLAPLVPEVVTTEPETPQTAPRERVVSVPAPESRLVNSIGMEFVLISAGTFEMGSHNGNDNERPVHTVHSSQPFYLGIYSVTQHQWEAVMGDNPSRFQSKFQAANRPVENVSWEDVQEFIRRLNARECPVTLQGDSLEEMKLNDKRGREQYRLPTEAEWEYAARAGSTTDYCFGDDPRWLEEYAWHMGNSNDETHPVGRKKPNAWGLYDMYGNVSDWVQDWDGPYPSGPVTDPQGSSSGSSRMARGGSWLSDARHCWSANRGGDAPGGRHGNLGFRLLKAVL